MTGTRSPLHWVDWLVFAVTLIIPVAMGVYFALTGGRQRTTKEYLVANRKLSVVPVALSMFMSYLSAITVIGQTAEAYLYGVQMTVGLIGTLVGYSVCAAIFVPTFHKLKLVSVFQFLDARFQSRGLRLMCVLLSLVSMTIYMGMAMFAPATSLEAVTGFPLWATVIIMGGVTTFYATIGGMKAVVWTDSFQAVVLFVGIVAVLILGTNKAGGVLRVWEISRDQGRHNWFDFNPDPTMRVNFWMLVFGRMFYSIIQIGTGQNNVQRYCSLPTLLKARLAVMGVCLCYISVNIIIYLLGLVMFSYFHIHGCDPLRGRLVFNSNQLLPYFVVNVLSYRGLSGMFLSVLFAGALSTLSSSVSAASAVTWKDILEKRFKKIAENRKALITKVLVFFYGCLAILVAFAVRFLPGHILQVAYRVLPGVSGPVSGILALGIFAPFANALGSGIGGLVAFAFCTWINIGANIYNYHRYTLPTTVDNCTFRANQTALPNPTNPPANTVFPLYRLSFMLVGVAAVLITLVVGIIASLLTGGEKAERRKARYIIPLTHYLCCCCPRRFHEALSCGVDHYAEDQEVQEQEQMTKVHNGRIVENANEIIHHTGNAKENNKAIVAQDISTKIVPKLSSNMMEPSLLDTSDIAMISYTRKDEE